MQKNDNLLKTKRLLKLKYKLQAKRWPKFYI